MSEQQKQPLTSEQHRALTLTKKYINSTNDERAVMVINNGRSNSHTSSICVFLLPDTYKGYNCKSSCTLRAILEAKSKYKRNDHYHCTRDKMIQVINKLLKEHDEAMEYIDSLLLGENDGKR